MTRCDARVVVLPEFQGFGIGTKLSDTVAHLGARAVSISLPRRTTRVWEATGTANQHSASYVNRDEGTACNARDARDARDAHVVL